MDETVTSEEEWSGSIRRNHSSRDPAFDLGRGIAITMIVISHVLRRGELTDALGAAAVTYFFWSGGYFFSQKQRLRKTFRKLYLPYLGVAIVSILLYRILGSVAAGSLGVSADKTRIMPNLWAMLYANSKDGSMKWNETLWFVPCYLVTVLLASWVMRLHSKRILIITMALCTPLVYLLTEHLHLHLPWQAETALHMLPVFILGILYRDFREAKERKKYGPGAATAGMILTVLYGCLFALWRGLGLKAVVIRVDRHPLYPLSLCLAMIGVLAIAAVSRGILDGIANTAAEKIGGKTGGRPLSFFFETAGRRSMSVMLWNKFPVLAVQVAVGKAAPGLQKLFVENDSVTGLLLATCLGILCVAACLLWSDLLHKIAGLLHRRFCRRYI